MHRQHQLEQTVVLLQEDIKRHQQESLKQERQSERYRLELEHLRADYDRLLLDDEELQRRWTEQTKVLLALEKQHASLTQQVTILEALHVALLRENKQLSQEKWQLCQEIDQPAQTPREHALNSSGLSRCTKQLILGQKC